MTQGTHSPDLEEAQTRGLSFSDVFRMTAKHWTTIAFFLTALFAAYVIVAAVLLIMLPAETVTTLAFTLEFRGAERGEYPNKTKFRSTEIISTPVLARVYRTNRLDRYIDFDTFRTSIFIVEANDSLEVLAMEYRAKLADPKLSAIDRGRIEKEFEEKKAALSKAEYSLSFTTRHRFTQIPTTLRMKVLPDILSVWADLTVKDKGVALYDLSILSSRVFEREQLKAYDYIMALDLIRSRMNRVIEDIAELSVLPGAKVMRADGSGRSLAELRVSLEDTRDFRLRPVLGMILAKGLSNNPATTTEFLRSQLRFNELDTQEAVERVNTVRDAIETYVQKRSSVREPAGPSPTGTTMIPQVDESFLNRIAELAGQAGDLEYRQKLVDELRTEALTVVPLQAETRYYQTLLETFSTNLRLPTPDEESMIETQIDTIISAAARDTADVFEIYEDLSKDLNPSTTLYSVTRPARSEIERPIVPLTLLSGAFLLLVIATPLTIFVVILYEILRATRRADESTAGATHLHAPSDRQGEPLDSTL